MAPTNGVVEETGKVAGGVVESLKNSPALLTLVVFNCAILGLLGWLITSAAASRHEQVMFLLRSCVPHVTQPGGTYFEYRREDREDRSPR